MPHPFKRIIILYNPVSTGDSQQNAEDLKQKLTHSLSKQTKIELFPTQYAGHAEEVGAKYGSASETLLVSSSGDGGYNELINGVLAVKNNTAAVCVLPSGNANDHYHATEGSDVAQMIIHGKTRMIDVLQIAGTKDGQQWSRYAHSYIGAGVTAYIGKKLTEADLNPINEKWLVLKYLVKFGHVSLKVDSWGHKRFYRYGSFVIGNIDKMSKIIKLDKNSSITDGKLEVYAVRSSSFSGLLKAVVKQTISNSKLTDRTDEVKIVSKKRLEVQCDGEVFLLDGNKLITTVVEPAAIRTIH